MFSKNVSWVGFALVILAHVLPAGNLSGPFVGDGLYHGFIATWFTSLFAYGGIAELPYLDLQDILMWAWAFITMTSLFGSVGTFLWFSLNKKRPHIKLISWSFYSACVAFIGFLFVTLNKNFAHDFASVTEWYVGHWVMVGGLLLFTIGLFIQRRKFHQSNHIK